ncbi:hypothetical protein BGZ70_001208 [Mortierella alpina]|uniref:MICOS complex subunit n=1 Tax=Mortierella alpina TaxID=64518 RepID=A0A9P6JC11_MORAP|nr:hypothetical protein BGZ70_001208 [Mortierella alpina]
MNDDAYRRLKADQEPLLPGLAYAGAAAVGGSILVNRIRSVPVKILTPLALGAMAGSYFLPAHTDLLKNTWTPMRISKTGAPVDASNSTSMRDLKRSTNDAAFELGNKTVEAVDDVSRQAQASWDDIKRKGENLADAYREAGKEQVHKVVDESVQGAKSWLDQQKNEADRLLNETASILSASTSTFPSSRKDQSEDTNRFHDVDRSSSSAPSQLDKERAFFKEQSQEQPSSSRWSWWSRSNSASPAKEQATDKETDMVTDGFANVKPVPRRRERSSPSLNLNDGESVVESLPGKPRKIVVDKAVASAAIKGHDNIVNREALHGRNAEETARKVHENVIDATVPRHRQGRHEIHKLEVSRQASESDLRDGQFVVREIRNHDDVPQRIRRGSGIKKDISHGLQNLEKRAHMLYDGVEHLEHSINKRVQKSLEEEAEFWHQQSLKEEANARAGERAM